MRTPSATDTFVMRMVLVSDPPPAERQRPRGYLDRGVSALQPDGAVRRKGRFLCVHDSMHPAPAHSVPTEALGITLPTPLPYPGVVAPPAGSRGLRLLTNALDKRRGGAGSWEGRCPACTSLPSSFSRQTSMIGMVDSQNREFRSSLLCGNDSRRCSAP